MKRILLTILLIQFFYFGESQFLPDIDSVKLLVSKSTSDSAKVFLYSNLSFTYSFLQVDSSIAYAQTAIRIARQLKYKEGEAAAMFSYGWAFWASGNYDKAIEAGLKALNLYKDLKDDYKVIATYEELALFYMQAGDSDEALKYARLSKNLFELTSVSRKLLGVFPYTTIGSVFSIKNQIDSASFYLSKAYEWEKADHYLSGYTLDRLGTLEAQKKNYQKALDYFYALLPDAVRLKNYFDIADTYALIAGVYHETGNIDSSTWYAKEVLNKPHLSIFRKPVLDALTILAQNYRLKHNNDSALKYLELRIATNDSLFNKEKSRAVQNLTFNEQLRQQEIETNRMQFQNKLTLYAVITISTVFLVIGIILYRNNKVKHKANVLLQLQKQKVESTLSELKSTQSQLIQSEKMASLGELTAGIAHEIQNPLNFVNNFSDVNKELLIEMNDEIDKGNLSEVKLIAKDIIDNEEKINHHGKRADAIVKGMLQHSRSSSGVKEPTDINALADEYLRLAYHGLRAKDKSFNAMMKTDLDETIGSIKIVPQDIGRVILNLITNAFYTVAEKKSAYAKSSVDNNYEPTVTVGTKKMNGAIEVIVEDNGNGIPPKVLDKIFQPFFTTKPTGQGTGLGLSLSYDIVKAHGGELKVDTKDREGSTFTIVLPAK
ncbi:MAG: tetratricopeptide repeat protein [Bacteroidetes bacterium]|nr:MAG: tetratricopeptide repeat protein [Bacteroidota bacterium]